MRVLILAKSRECQNWYKFDSNVAIPVLETMYAADADQSRKKIGPDLEKKVNTSSSSLGYQYR